MPLAFGLGRHAPSVMGFVVDHDDILGRSHILEHFTHVGFVADRAPFVDTFLFAILSSDSQSSLCQLRTMTLPWRSLS